MSNGSGKERLGQAGFTYVAALVLIATVGLGLAATGEFWSQTRKREKEAELIWTGNQFRQAIGLYYQRSPGSVKRYPDKLDDLLEDKRFLSTQRYLRRIYADPITGSTDWQLVPAPGGGFMGVKSQSAGKPLKLLDGKSAESYGSWEFSYVAPVAAAAGGRTAK